MIILSHSDLFWESEADRLVRGKGGASFKHGRGSSGPGGMRRFPTDRACPLGGRKTALTTTAPTDSTAKIRRLALGDGSR
jgi:hypothetical protein